VPLSKESPKIRTERPPKEIVTAMEIAKSEVSDRKTPVPITMHIHPEITKLSLLDGLSESSDMLPRSSIAYRSIVLPICLNQ